MAQNIRAIGIAWYRLQDYRRIREIMEDADKLPTTYDQWIKSAETGERELKRAGNVVVRAIIDPEEFVVWCSAHSLKVDAQARMEWANTIALRQIIGSH